MARGLRGFWAALAVAVALFSGGCAREDADTARLKKDVAALQKEVARLRGEVRRGARSDGQMAGSSDGGAASMKRPQSRDDAAALSKPPYRRDSAARSVSESYQATGRVPRPDLRKMTPEERRAYFEARRHEHAQRVRERMARSAGAGAKVSSSDGQMVKSSDHPTAAPSDDKTIRPSDPQTRTSNQHQE